VGRRNVLTFLAVATLLAGCGGSSPNQSAANRERSQEAQSEARFADYAKCLREHGIDAEVESSAGEGHGLKVTPKEGAGEGAMQAAERACARYRPQPKQVNLSPQQKVEREEAVQRFARCMREHGIKVEASASGSGIAIGVHPGSGGPNPRSPAFQQAQSDCQKLLPGGGPKRHGYNAVAGG
jgi:hypothetical protein